MKAARQKPFHGQRRASSGVLGLGFRVWGLGFRVLSLGFRVWGIGFWVLGFGFRVRGLGFRVLGLGACQGDKGRVVIQGLSLATDVLCGSCRR